MKYVICNCVFDNKVKEVRSSGMVDKRVVNENYTKVKIQ